MNRNRILVGCALVVALLTLSIAGMAGTSSSLLGTRYQVGEAVEFKVETETTWFWGCNCGCCSCDEAVILGWRVVASTGMTVYSVVHDAAVSASLWQGSWAQTGVDGLQVAVGDYVLYVDTSVGTLSRCFSIYDPCNRCYTCPSCTTCSAVSHVTDCNCRTSLVFIDSCTGCFPLFGFFRTCCDSCTSCSGGCP